MDNKVGIFSFFSGAGFFDLGFELDLPTKLISLCRFKLTTLRRSN